MKIQMRHDIRLLRHRVMRLPFIEHIQAAWLVHGGSSVMLRWNTIDKWSVSLCGLGCDVSLLCPVSNDNAPAGMALRLCGISKTGILLRTPSFTMER